MKNINTSYYFPHDYDARADEKLAALRVDHGALGYGIYWDIVEMLHQDANSRLEISERKLKRLAAALKVPFTKYRQIIEDCVEVYELFTMEDGCLCSKRVVMNKVKRKDISDERSKAGKESGRVRAAKREQMLEQNEQIGTNANKGKESKENENKVKETTTSSAEERSKQEVFLKHEELMHSALDTEEFVAANDRMGVQRPVLDQWLLAFNRHLAFTGTRWQKDNRYRRHFANWLKFQEYNARSPDEYNPIDEPLPTTQPQETIDEKHEQALKKQIAFYASKAAGADGQGSAE